MAFGKLFSEVATMMYWLSNAVWLGGTLTAVTIGVIDVFFTPKHPLNTWESIIVGLVFTWVTILLSVINLKYGKWTGNIGTSLKGLAMAVLLILTVVFLARHGLPHGHRAGQLLHAQRHGLPRDHRGHRLPLGRLRAPGSASEEMVNPQKDVPRSIFSAGLITTGMYIAVMLCMLLLLTEKQLGAATGIPAAVNVVLDQRSGRRSKGPGLLPGSVLILTYLSSASVWTLGSARVQAVAALDGSAPRLLGKFSKQGTPLPMCILMGVVGSVMCVIIFLVTSGSLKASSA